MHRDRTSWATVLVATTLGCCAGVVLGASAVLGFVLPANNRLADMYRQEATRADDLKAENIRLRTDLALERSK